MKSVHPRGTLWEIGMLSVLLCAGCSLILDPTTCEDDSECNGGVCQSGVCVGGVEVVADAEMDEQVPRPDAAIDAAPPSEEMGVDATPDVAPLPEADVPDVDVPDVLQAAPACRIVEPEDGTVSAERQVDVVIEVTDEDNAADELEVRVNGDRVTLDESGQVSLRVALEMEGDNPVALTASDPAGANCEASITLVSDRTPPAIEMLSPAADSRVLTNLPVRTVSGRVVDAHFVPTLSITVNEELLDPEGVEVTWNENAFEVGVPIVAGLNTVALVTSDVVENTSDPVGFEIVYDDQNPTVTLVSPPADQSTDFLESVIVVEGSVADEGMPVGRGPVLISVTGPEAGQSAEFPTNTDRDGLFSQRAQLFDGANTLTVCARDEADNQGCVSAQAVKIDSLPCVAITDPTPREGETLVFSSVAAINVTGTVCPSVEAVALSVFRCPGDPAAACDDPVVAQQDVAADIADGGFTARVLLAGAGYYAVRAVASNAEAETAQAETRVQFDNTAPQVQISAPRDNECLNSLDVRVCASFDDPDTGLRRLTINGDEYPLPAAGAFCDDVRLERDGEVELVVQVQNQAGLRGEDTRPIRIDRTLPDVQLDDPSGEGGLIPWFGPTQDSVVLTGTVDAGLCPTERFTINGSPVSIDAESERFSHRIQLAEGLQDVIYQIQDEAGNEENNGGLTVNIDLSAPVIDDPQPADGSFTAAASENVTVRIADRDIEGTGGSGVVAVTVERVPLARLPEEEPFRAGEDFDLVEGLNSFEFTALDLVGNRATQTVRIFRDTVAPTLSVVSPRPDDPAVFPLSVWLRANDEGSGIETVTVNGAAAERVGESDLYRADLVAVDLDAPTLSVRAFDGTGNEAEPVNQAVTIRDFGAYPTALEGLGEVGSVSWTDAWDVDRNGRPDLVALTSDPAQSSVVYLQDAAGRFVANSAGVVGLPENLAVRDAALGDVNADDRMDLIIVGDGRSVVASGAPGGRFVIAQAGLLDAAAPQSISLGDINRDGHLDAILSAGADQTRLFYNGGDGTFESEQLNLFGLDALPLYTRSRVVDLDGDAVADIIGWGAAGAVVYLGARDSSFSRFGGDNPIVGDTAAVAVFDADRSGTVDLFLGKALGSELHLVAGPGAIAAADRPVAWEFGDRGAIPLDYDGDTRDDLLVYGQQGIRLVRGTADGFEDTDGAALGLPEVGAVSHAQVVDVDGDGDLDIVVAGVDGLRVVRSNRVGRVANPMITLDIRREKQPDPIEGQRQRDAVGTTVLLDYDGGAELDAMRALIPHPATPSPITLGDAAQINVGVRFIDKGGIGSNQRRFVGEEGLTTGAEQTVYGRE